MARYNLLIKPSAVKEIEDVPSKKERQLIISRINKLADAPRPLGCEKLSGHNKYRLRQGHFRIVYSIDDNHYLIYVVKVSHRKNVYRRL